MRVSPTRPTELGDSKVEDLDEPLTRNEQIGRFDVAVNDARLMRFGEPARNLFRDVDRRGGIERAAQEAMIERLAFVIGHAEKKLAVRGLVDVVDGADVRMIEREAARASWMKRCLASKSRVSS